MKIQVSWWWFKDAVDGICRGKDILEVKDDFKAKRERVKHILRDVK